MDTKELITEILEDPQDETPFINEVSAEEIVNSEELMLLIEQHRKGWIIISDNTVAGEAIQKIASMAIARTTLFDDVAYFLYCKPEEIKEKALAKIEEMARTSRQFVIVAKSHHDKGKIEFFLMEAGRTAQNIPECFDAINGSLRNIISFNVELIEPMIRKAVKLSKDSKDIKKINDFLWREINNSDYIRSSDKKVANAVFVRAVVENKNICFFGKDTVSNVLDIITLERNQKLEEKAFTLLQAVLIIEKMKSDAQERPGCPEQIILDKLCQNS